MTPYRNALRDLAEALDLTDEEREAIEARRKAHAQDDAEALARHAELFA